MTSQSSSSSSNSAASTSSSSPPSSRQSSPSRTASKMSPNTSTDPNVVIRCGFVIPQIRLTPPDERPAKAPAVPEQDLGPNSLYVPLRTEEVGWEEGGLIWAPKRYCYPTVNLYGGADDRVIGTYRGGPEGYRFINITDSAFSLAEEATESSSSTSSSSTKTRGSKSKMPRGPAKVTASPAAAPIVAPTPTAESPQCLSEDGDSEMEALPVGYASSSASSSRQSSFSSTDDGQSSGADTGMTSPAHDGDDVPMKTNDGSALTPQLDAALNNLLSHSDENCTDDSEEEGTTSTATRRLASRTGAGTISSATVDAARLGGPLKQQLVKSNTLGHDRSLQLAEQVPTHNFAAARGRATAKLSVLDSYVSSDDRAGEFAGGWAYEQNMKTQHQLDDGDAEATT